MTAEGTLGDPGRGHRLQALRDALRSGKVDAFFLQRTDQHNGEYLPASEERVAWLTGFDGSNAQVVVTANEAAVFSDGRYTTQLREQADAALFERCHIVEEPPLDWLARRAQPGWGVGYDPLLTKHAELARLRRLAKSCSCELVALERNPLDELWQTAGRPEPPCGEVHEHAVAHAGESAADKCRRMGEAVANAKAEQLLVTAADEIAWLLNIRGADIPFNPLCLSHLLLGKDGQVRWFVVPEKLGRMPELPEAVSVEAPDDLLPALRSLGEAQAAVLADPATVHVAFSQAIENAGGRVLHSQSPIPRAKAIKNAVELSGARQAQWRDALAVVRFLAWLDGIPLDGSITELAAVAKLVALREEDERYRGPSFDTISAHGPHAALPHYRVTPQSDRPLTGGTVYLVDSGGQYLDGTTDITRTVPLGEVEEPAVSRHFTLVLKGHIALAQTIFPKGTHGGQLDTLARLALWREGLDFDHGTGHGIGSYLCVHEGPQRIAKAGSQTALAPGMILSNEPGFYKEGHYGIRIENLVIVETREVAGPDARPMLGFETMSLAPIDRRLIDIGLLDNDERNWLDAYHRQVEQSLIGHLDDETASWLKRMCAPLH